MKIKQVPFTVIEWETEPVTEVPGKSGTAHMRTVMDETLCVRMVDFTPGYSAYYGAPGVTSHSSLRDR